MSIIARKHYFIMGLLVLVTILFLSCKSAPSEKKAEVYFDEKPSIVHPFFVNSHTNMFMKNKGIIEHIFQSFGINATLISPLITHIQISVSDQGFSLVATAKNTSFKEKEQLMRRIKAVNILHSERFWAYYDEETNTSMFFDLGYNNQIVVSNLDIESLSRTWTWVPSQIFIDSQEDGAEAWVWSNVDSMLGDFSLISHTLRWIGIVVASYDIAKNAMSMDFIISHNGDVSMKTTVKLLLPLLIKNITGKATFGSLPDVQMYNNLIVFKRLTLDIHTFWNELVPNEYAQ